MPKRHHQLVYTRFDPADEGRRETLLALGNGLLTVRAAAPWACADGVHYPGTYRAGLYNRLTEVVEGEEVWNESLVNLPNWLPLNFRHAGEDRWFSLRDVEILDYRHVLDLEAGMTTRALLVRDRQGRQTRLCEHRLVSMAHPELCALHLDLAALNWSGLIELRSALDGSVINDRVHRLRCFDRQHLHRIAHEAPEPGAMLLHAWTRQSSIALAVAARTRLVSGKAEQARIAQDGPVIAEHRICHLSPGAPLAVEKTVAIVTSLDAGGSDVSAMALASLRAAPDFGTLQSRQRTAWAPLNEKVDLEAEQPELEDTVHLTAFQILQTASPHSARLDLGFPARGWQEAYRGQIFWDEIFVLPFFAHRFPETARALLLYRYRRLEDARAEARRQGYRGAMFPWRSASDGREHTPRFQWNPLSGRWMEDHTRLQRHIGSAIAYNVWHYAAITGDDGFLAGEGAVLMLEIARFWASIAEYDAASGRYDIQRVSGPDEFHVAYPGAVAPGIANNTYTNVMASWTLARALELLEWLPAPRRAELQQALELSEAELGRWDDVSRHLRLFFSEDGGLLPFQGFDRLQDVNLKALTEAHGGKRLDWALECEGKSLNDYQVMKQADTMLLPHLLSGGDLDATLSRMGYPMTEMQWRMTAEHDLARTTHDSSLSKLAFAGALKRLDPARSWEFFAGTLKPERDPSSASAVAEGAHLGALGSMFDVLQRHYLGVHVRRDGILLDPAPPPRLKPVRFRMDCRFGGFALRWQGDRLHLAAHPRNGAAAPVRHAEGEEWLRPGDEMVIRPG